MAASVATGLAITNPLVKYRALLATKVIAPDPVRCPFTVQRTQPLTDLVTGTT